MRLRVRRRLQWRGPAIALVLLATAALGVAAASAALSRLGWDAPGPDGLPPAWEPLTFKKVERHTRYSVLEQDGRFVVKAEARASASGLIRRLDLDPRSVSALRWSWRVENLLDKADIARKQGDDYPARIYVAFAYDPSKASVAQRLRYEAARLIYGQYPPHAGLNYVWDGGAAAGTITPNAYTARVRMIVVESGTARLGQWVAYERDILEDYRRAFGAEPPRISGVAIMTDADDTGGAATAYYGDVFLTPSTH
jgi:hypothetical protein